MMLEDVNQASDEEDQSKDERKDGSSSKGRDRKGRSGSPKKSQQRKKKTKKTSSKSPSRRSRANKIYRTPVTPEPEELLFREKSFVLDCNATSSISRDYSRVNPKLGPVIPPYNAHYDSDVQNYFNYYGVNRTLKKTGQTLPSSTSIEGPVVDRFHRVGAGASYLKLRNSFGAGHSQETIDGHGQFMLGVKEVIGYNGKYGFRRNTPCLRKHPTPFEPAVILPTQGRSCVWGLKRKNSIGSGEGSL